MQKSKYMEKYRNDILGFSLDIPDGWETIPAQWAKNFRMKAAPTSEKLAEYLTQASTPFLFLQHPTYADYAAMPVVQCVVKPLNVIAQIGSIAKVIDVTLALTGPAFKNFALIERIDEMLFAGSKAGYLKMSMTVTNDHEADFDCVSEVYFFSSSTVFFMMGFSGAFNDELRPIEDFKSIQRSIRLT